MATLPIITLPDPLLREKSSAIEQVDDDLRHLMDEMLETMYDAPGIGLAAIQVGVPKRLVVIDIAEEDSKTRNPMCFVNPEILALGSELGSYEEGCLSLPDIRVDIERPTTLTLRYVDRDGKEQQLDADGLLARAIQHEVDHLDGRLIIDFMSSLKRNMVIRKFRKMARA